MAKDRRKIEKKTRKADKKRKSERLYQAQKAKRKSYPRIVVDPRGGDPEFVRMVSRIVGEMDFTDSARFDKRDQGFLQCIRTAGIDSLPAVFEQVCDEMGVPFSVENLLLDVMRLMLRLGQNIFTQLPEEVRESPLPRGFFQLLPRNHDLNLSFGFAPTVGDATNPIYCPRDEPLLTFGPVRWPVGFYRHAIEQLCLRIRVHDIIEYSDFTRCFMYFKSCQYFECVRLADGQPAIRLYYPVGEEGSVSHSVYVQQILGDRYTGQAIGQPCYVLGYCPFDEQITKGRVVAKTFLFPGYKNTPEDQAVKTARITGAERRRLLEAASHNASHRVLFSGNTDVIKWYHENGVPQVKHISETITAPVRLF
jgi:hypothetical protein